MHENIALSEPFIYNCYRSFRVCIIHFVMSLSNVIYSWPVWRMLFLSYHIVISTGYLSKVNIAHLNSKVFREFRIGRITLTSLYLSLFHSIND